MARVKRGTISNKRRRSVLSAAKGYRFGRGNKEREAKVAIMHAGVHAFAHRKTKKRLARSLWSLRINAAARIEGTTYSKLIGNLKKASISIDRKVLATMAKDHPESFARLVQKVS